MPTLGQLKERVITETNRDELRDDLANLLNENFERAIKMWESTPFWFNTARTVTTFEAGNEYQNFPSDFHSLIPDSDNIFLPVGPNRYTLCKISWEAMEGLHSIGSVGQPTDFCIMEDNIRLWPIPSQGYRAIWNYTKRLPALTTDNDENAWTNAAQYLIVATVKMFLYRDAWRDEAGASAAMAAADEAKSELIIDTGRRMGTGRIYASW